MQKLMDFYDWKSWPDFFPTEFHTIKDDELFLVLETDEFRVFSSPVQHWVPTVGLRIEFLKAGKVVAYSSDTAPTSTIFGLARDADILIHEAAGASEGHSSAEQAGAIAAGANAKELYLIHYPTGGFDYSKLVDEAAKMYKGPVKIAEDLTSFEFD
jgi:ribonuclease Z